MTHIKGDTCWFIGWKEEDKNDNLWYINEGQILDTSITQIMTSAGEVFSVYMTFETYRDAFDYVQGGRILHS